MKKLFELQNSNSNTQFTSQLEKDDDSFFLIKKKTDYIRPDNIINIEKKIISPNKSNYKKDNKSMINNYNIDKLYETSKDVNLKRRKSLVLNNDKISEKNKYYKLNPINDISNKNNIVKRRASLMPNIHNKTNKTELFNSFNLFNFLSKKANNIPFLPNINENIEENIKTDKPYKIKNDKKELTRNNNDNIKRKRTKSFYTSTKNNYPVNIKKLDKKDNNINSKSQRRKLVKMKTVLNLHKDLNYLYGDSGSKNDNKIIKENNEKGFQNHELLYSTKFNNYVVKIYKTNEDKEKKSKMITKKKLKFKIQNKKPPKKSNNKSPKFTIKEYLHSFNPKNFIEKIKNKQNEIDIGDSKEMKEQLLDKAYIYIENFIFKKNKNKKKQDALELIKEKNIHLINKYRKKYIQKLINKILLKTKIKHLSIIFNINLDYFKIIENVNFHIYITLSIIKHVITRSEKDENLYFINLIKHVLYSGNKKITLRFPFFKRFEFFIKPFIKKATSINKFIENNNKKIFFLYFTLKFQNFDCETILQVYEEKEYKSLTKKTTKPLNASNIDNNKNELESEKLSTIEHRIRRTRRRHKTIKHKLSTTSSKFMNINLTKSIIKLRATNLENELRKRNNFKINMLNNYKSKIINISDSSDNDENQFVKKISRNSGISNANTFTNPNIINNLIANNKCSIEEDNREVHYRDKKLLFERFISCIEFSDYDELYHWLKKSERNLDLNYKFDNGDTLLHLCVRHSVPLYIIEYLIYHGININSQNNHGDTALHLAVKNHKYKTVNLLIKMGASEYIYNKKQKNCWECL